jgi:bifunctional DNA-binding transcriptional regulator/antitoxin component of YhaV-PrlF toxin-antitoxin module
METIAMGKYGAIVVPNRLRKRYRLEDGTPIQLEELEDGIVIRPIATTMAKTGRLAQLLINNVLTEEGYLEARRCVGETTIDPDSVERLPLQTEGEESLPPQPRFSCETAQARRAEGSGSLGPDLVRHLQEPAQRWFRRLRPRRIT